MGNKPLKVLLVFGHRGKLGAIRMVVSLERALRKHEVEVFFAVENLADFDGYPELAARTFEVSGLTDWRSLKGKLKSPFPVLGLLQVLKHSKADVMYVHHLAAFPYALAASKLTCVPHVVVLQNVYGKKERYKKLLLHRAKNVLAVSQFMLDYTSGFHGNDIIGKYVVYNGIDIDAFLSSSAIGRLPPHLHSPREKVVVGMVSAMDKNKDPQFLLRVARRVVDVEPNVIFVFVGRFPDREYEKETMRLAEQLKLEGSVAFEGYQKDVSVFFGALDILAHPRPAEPEAFGLVLIEAMAHGKPVVASNIGGIPEVIRHNETGFLCTPGDKEQFAKALLRLICDPGLREEFGHNSYRRVRETFSIEKTAMDMAKVFRTIADKSRGGNRCIS